MISSFMLERQTPPKQPRKPKIGKLTEVFLVVGGWTTVILVGSLIKYLF